MRSPASVFVDSILRPCFLAAVERKPRTLWACQDVAFMISARVAPLGRPINSRILAPLLSARGALDSLSATVFAAFFAVLAVFFGAGLPDFAPFLALGTCFLGLVPFFEEALAGATVRPCSATAAAFSVVVASAFVMVFILSAADPRMTIHHSGASEKQGKSSWRHLA